MADKGYVNGLLSAIPDATTKRVVQKAFEYVLDNMRLGAPEHQRRATNLQSYWLEASTPAAANEEFSIVHGLNAVPAWAWPMLELDKPGAKLVPLEVTRAADNKRIYLRSSSTSAPIVVLVEA
jgi:hypothetical protein